MIWSSWVIQFQNRSEKFFSKKFLYYLLGFFQNGRRTQTRSMNTRWTKVNDVVAWRLDVFNYSILNHHAVSNFFFTSFFQDGKFHAAIVKEKKEGGRKKRGGDTGASFPLGRHHSTRTHGAYTLGIYYTHTHTQTLLDTQRRCPKEALNPHEFLSYSFVSLCSTCVWYV